MIKPSDWRCPNVSCVNHIKLVFGSKESCPKCGASREDADLEKEEALEAADFVRAKDECGSDIMLSEKGDEGRQGGERAPDWQCPNASCINHTKMVFGKHSSCPSCGTLRNAGKPGDWKCPNGQCVNHSRGVFANKPACPKCGSVRPSGRRGGGADHAPNFPRFEHRPSMSMPLAIKLPFKPQPPPMAVPLHHSPPGAESKPVDWQCPNESCVNHRKMVFAKNSTCPRCGAMKPVPVFSRGREMMHRMTPGPGKAVNGPSSRRGSLRDGDWRCPDPNCINHSNGVFARHNHCPSCGAEKDEDGEVAARSRSPRRMANSGW